MERERESPKDPICFHRLFSIVSRTTFGPKGLVKVTKPIDLRREKGLASIRWFKRKCICVCIYAHSRNQWHVIDALAWDLLWLRTIRATKGEEKESKKKASKDNIYTLTVLFKRKDQLTRFEVWGLSNILAPGLCDEESWVRIYVHI